MERTTVDVDGVRISFLKGRDVPLVYVHSSGCDARLWLKQLDAIGGYAIDLPNHGESGRAEINSADDYAYYVAKASERLLDRAVFAGHSLGGAVVQKVYLNYPEIVKGLILVGTGARLRVLPELLEGLKSEPEKYVDFMLDMAFARRVPEYEWVRDVFSKNVEVLRRDLEICDRFDLLEDYRSGRIRVDVPTLIIVGRDDRLTPVKYAEFFHRHIEGSRLVVIDDAGHMVMLEQPERFNEALGDFLKGLL